MDAKAFVLVVQGEHVKHLAKNMTMHQHGNSELTGAQDERGTYVVHHGLAALLPHHDLLVVAMEFVA
jgi:hypothetical protein